MVKTQDEIDKCIEAKEKNPENEVSIRMKCNAFTDKRIAKKLYEASSKGVIIKLIIRGMCIIKAGVEGLSENIEVISIVGRYLEHSRIYEFKYMEDEKPVSRVFIGSGDMMPRNLDHRVEVIVPIKKSSLKKQISAIFDNYFSDNTNSYKLLPDGTYSVPDESIDPENQFSVQDTYIKLYKKMEKSLLR